jgi:N-methylhydantoinase B
MMISVIERTRVPGFGQAGGKSGLPNHLSVDYPDGRTRELRKITDLKVPAGARVRVRCGGGGGYGPPAERDRDAVLKDLRDGFITLPAARAQYPHAFETTEA